MRNPATNQPVYPLADAVGSQSDLRIRIRTRTGIISIRLDEAPQLISDLQKLVSEYPPGVQQNTGKIG